MAGKIPNAFIQDLLTRIDLVDLIDSRVPLKPSGSNFVARCPFHTEKSPSFTVSRTKQFYHCFGCGASGNAIGFLMNYERLGFVEAVEALAESLGLKLPNDVADEAFDKQQALARRLFEVQALAARFYQKQLKNSEHGARAVCYLKARGVSGEIARHFQVGYAPPGWRSLPPDMPQDLLEATGLLIAKDGSRYDRFRDRIMFPIRDRRGRVVGFGGRVLGDETPKYLNSPETPVFRKQKEVYGLWELLAANSKPAFIMVVEGYLDVVALAQHGVTNCVATLGTATTGEHVELLFRFTDEIVFCFDGDAAGQKAAWKALEASLPALREGRQLKFLRLPEKHDPDSLIRSEGAEHVKALIRGAIPFSQFFFERLAAGLDLKTLEGRAALIKAANNHIDKLNIGIFRDLLEQRLAELTGYGRVEKNTSRPTVNPPRSRPGAGQEGRLSGLRLLIALLLQNPGLGRTLEAERRQRLESRPKGGALVREILRHIDEKPGLTTGALLEYFRGRPEEAWLGSLVHWDTMIASENVPAVFADALRQLERQIKDERLAQLIERSQVVPLSPDELEEMRGLTSG